MYTTLNPLNRIQREPFSLGAAALTGGVGLLGQGLNLFSQERANKKQREWNEKMYDTQKRDNIDFWNMNNSYNSPQAQMARLQEAGLNPNLVYGNGATATSSSAPNVPNAMPYKPSAPQFDLPQIFDQYFDIKSKQQNLDNMKKMGDNLVLDGLIKGAQAEKLKTENGYLDSLLHVKLEEGTNRSNLVYETMISKALNNLFMSGHESQNLGYDGGSIRSGSGYDLQFKGMSLINQLRKLEASGKETTNDINEIRRNYTKRTMSGEFKDMSAKDIIMSLIHGASLFK